MSVAGRQHTYRLVSNRADVWDSGRVESDRLQCPYKGSIDEAQGA